MLTIALPIAAAGTIAIGNHIHLGNATEGAYRAKFEVVEVAGSLIVLRELKDRCPVTFAGHQCEYEHSPVEDSRHTHYVTVDGQRTSWSTQPI